MSSPCVLCLVGALLGGAAASAEGCPPASEVEAVLEGLAIERAAQTSWLDEPAPWALYRRAADEPGRIVVGRQGKRGHAVLLAERPVDRVWMAVSDEGHFGEASYPVDRSVVVSGDPGGSERILFQSVERFGIGRWWVSRVRTSPELYERSDGRLWELTWEDVMDTWDRSTLPLGDLDRDVAPIHSSRGAWLLATVDAECTLIDYFSWSDPGGLVALATPFVLTRGLRDTLRGVLDMVDGHMGRPHPEIVFERPDGSTMPPLGRDTTGGDG